MMIADAHISSLGYLWLFMNERKLWYRKKFPLKYGL